MYIQYSSARDGQNIFHLVYYLDSCNNHFRREVRVLYGIEYSFDALDVAKYEVSYY